MSRIFLLLTMLFVFITVSWSASSYLMDAVHVYFIPYGNVASDNVQKAIMELDSEKGALAGNNTWTGTNTFSSTVIATVKTAEVSLNADKLDGYDSAAFARLAVANTFTESPQTLSKNTNSGIYFSVDNANTGSSVWNGYLFYHNGTYQGGTWWKGSGASFDPRGIFLWNAQNAPLIFGTNGAIRGRFTNSGQFIIGTATSSTYDLNVNSSAPGGGDAWFADDVDIGDQLMVYGIIRGNESANSKIDLTTDTLIYANNNVNIYINRANADSGAFRVFANSEITPLLSAYESTINTLWTSCMLYMKTNWPTVSSDGTNYWIGTDMHLYDEYDIESGVTDSGYRMGLRIQNHIEDLEFYGTLSRQYGAYITSGIYSAGSTGPRTVNKSYGIYLACYNTVGTITEKYGIYQMNPNFVNYFDGPLCVGQPLYSGCSFSTTKGFHTYGPNWVYTSDKNLKKNIRDIDNALSVIMRLRPRLFEWDDSVSWDDDKVHAGFVAQEYAEVFPDKVCETDITVKPAEYVDKVEVVEEKGETKEIIVREEKNKAVTVRGSIVDSNDLYAYIVGAIQEQQKQIEALERRVAELERKVGR